MRSAAVHPWLACFSLIATLCAACGKPPVVTKALPSPVLTRQEESLDPALFQAVEGENDGEAYRVGAGDALIVAVYGHPELSISQYTSALGAQGGRASGLVIDNDGTIQFPLLGSVAVAGKTSEQLRAFLESELSQYIKEPRVTVQVVFNGSIRYYLLGQFSQPGLKYSDRPLRLLETLALGGTVDMQKASLRGAYVARNGKRLPVNFRRLLRDGDLGQNIRMRPGDVVFVPDNQTEQAFVFAGSAGSSMRGGPVPFVNGELDLVQALAYVGLGFRERGQGRLSDTRVIRSEGDRGELYVVDVKRILNGEAASFRLQPGDVVYVPPTGMTNWNQALEQLLPSLETISNLLNPFVQIKFLSKD